MKITVYTTVGETVRMNFTTARIFEDHNIDFCCGGEISIREASEKAGIDPNNLILQLNKAMQHVDEESENIERMSLKSLSDHILTRHHTYVNGTIPFLLQKLQKLCDVHGENHPELFQVKGHFADAAGNLSSHMFKEESILFPYIRRMEAIDKSGAGKFPDYLGVEGPVREMMTEHQTEGDRFMKIAEITNQFQVPPDGCSTFEVTYQTLEEFVNDLHRHIHLENNILFPKALELEKRIIDKN
jgi:regulator of cell morphogenesis and NO signaling